MTVQKLSQSTWTPQQENLSLISPPAIPLLRKEPKRNKKKKHKEHQQPRCGIGKGEGWGGGEQQNGPKKKTKKNPYTITAVSRTGYSRKSKLKQSKLVTFTIAEEALLWKSFIQQMQSLPSIRISSKLF